MYAQSILGKAGQLSLFFSLSLFFMPASAQVRYSGTATTLLVSGTSTLHDWTMKSAKADCTATFDVDATGQITAIHALNFTTPVQSLKSDHTSMDNNAYKALKTEKAPVITYTLVSGTTAPGATGAATVTCNGKLTIAGATRDAQLIATCKQNADNTISVTGTEKISMKDFSIDPPTFMLGTIKTGNDITLSFTLILKRS
jgi:polyisoprenoid-binding protein YceI